MVSLLKNESGKDYIVVITDRYARLTQAIIKKKTTATRIANILKEHWVPNLGIPSIVLTGNGNQVTPKIFVTLCKELGLKTVTATTYHPQANGQVKSFNATMISILRHYVAEHQKSWDTFAFLSTYSYNVHVDRTTKLRPFSLAIT